MASKKSSTYGEIMGKKLGRHLPRIASGDAEEEVVDHEKQKEKERADFLEDRRFARERRLMERNGATPTRRVTQDMVVPPPPANTDDVAGVPGRLRLSRDAAPVPVSPLPSSRLTRGLWADVQRHLLQAYEYLCHVGEAQQWIEGCLDEELGFGVVEMEDGMRNGVVLAKLTRVFEGEGVVRKIYEVRFEDPNVV